MLGNAYTYAVCARFMLIVTISDCDCTRFEWRFAEKIRYIGKKLADCKASSDRGFFNFLRISALGIVATPKAATATK